ncbi:MAG: MFS transporter [Ignavibacteriae bacterium HGW-Ignavibacteriae-2]|jgi:MFS family permease|nr:MFS transporter [Bacteroidota bacterium]PKL88489.1 MAG: MFS transporter [Ignavibacteriae bacterium HGW-Ignavibacteriae-2]
MLNEKPNPPVLFRWTILIFISLAMFGNYYVYDSIAPIADLLKSNLGFTDENIGQMYSVYSIAAVVILLIGGIVIDKYGTKKSTLFFGTICSLAAVVTWVSSDLNVMLTGRVLLGLGAEPLIVAITTALAKWFKGKELSFAFGINLTIARLGSVAADNSPSWGKAFYTNWQDPLFLAVIIGLTCIIGGIVYWVLENRAEKKYKLSAAGETDKFVLKDLFGFSRSFWLIVALCVTFYSAIFPFRSFAIKFFIEAHGSSREFAGFLNSVLPLSAMIATPLFGLLVDKIGKRALLMMVGSILLLPVYLMMVYTNISLYVPIILMGISFSLIPAIMWPSVAYIVDEKRLGTAYALMGLIQQIGVAAFNWMIGLANDYSGASSANPGGYELGMWMFSVLGIFGFLFAFLLRRTEKGPNGHGLEKGMQTSNG